MQLSTIISLSFSLLSLTSFSTAQGLIKNITFSTTSFPGVKEGGNNSPVRAVGGGSSGVGFNSNDLVCGPGARGVTAYAKATPGDNVRIFWSAENGGAWPKQVGEPSSLFLSRRIVLI